MNRPLSDYLTYDPPSVPYKVLLQDGEHAPAVKLLMDTVAQLRAKGIMDTVRIRPHDEGNGLVFDVLQVKEA